MHKENDKGKEFMRRPKKNPFRTPESYFESLEDRIMGNIEFREKKKTRSSKVYLFLKPALALAASFALVYLLVYYPINELAPKSMVNSELTDTAQYNPVDEYIFHFLSIDENTLVNTIFSDEESTISQINQDELLAYLSNGMSDIEIYDEIQN